MNMAYYYFPRMIKLRKIFRRIVRYIHYINKSLINFNYKTKYNMSLETDTNLHICFLSQSFVQYNDLLFNLNLKHPSQLLVAYWLIKK